MAGNSNSGARIGKTAGATLKTPKPQTVLGSIPGAAKAVSTPKSTSSKASRKR